MQPFATFRQYARTRCSYRVKGGYFMLHIEVERFELSIRSVEELGTGELQYRHYIYSTEVSGTSAISKHMRT